MGKEEIKSKHRKKIEDIKKQEAFFEQFYKNAKSIFSNLQKKDFSSQVYQDRCILEVCPGSRVGGNNSDVVEVFWGIQPIKRLDKKNIFSTLKETGVTLLINLLPDGHVMITLYPAKTDTMKPIEDCIILHRFCKAEWLVKETNQKALWRDFMAYTECTSLIGSPSILQRLRVFWVKYSRPVYVNGVQMPIKGLDCFRNIFSFVFSVGLSGFLLYFIQQYNIDTKDYTPLVKQISNDIKSIQEIEDDIKRNSNFMNASVDSLKRDVLRRDSMMLNIFHMESQKAKK
jgi:hypothetical protein